MVGNPRERQEEPQRNQAQAHEQAERSELARRQDRLIALLNGSPNAGPYCERVAATRAR